MTKELKLTHFRGDTLKLLLSRTFYLFDPPVFCQKLYLINQSEVLADFSSCIFIQIYSFSHSGNRQILNCFETEI